MALRLLTPHLARLVRARVAAHREAQVRFLMEAHLAYLNSPHRLRVMQARMKLTAAGVR